MRLIDRATQHAVQTGAEKEFNLKKMASGSKLDGAVPVRWDPSLLPAASQHLAWADLDDRGKAQWALAHHAKYGDFPTMRALPGAEYSKIEFEKNGWIEIISNAFDDIDQLADFLKNFGWGHIHTSFMRGGGNPLVANQLTWMRNANLWCFLDGLAQRGASGNDEAHWKFSIKGLSIPTEQHLELASQILSGKNMVATAFSKHLIVNVRGSGMYGHRNRVGFETRGGSRAEKERMVDSLLDGLVNGNWGLPSAAQDNLRIVRLAPDELKYDKKRRLMQVKSLPREFGARITDHLATHPIEGMQASDGQRLFEFVSRSTFYPGGSAPDARLTTFDQRACVPLLNYEDLPWLTEAEKQRAISARGDFIRKLGALSAQNPEPVQRALGVCNLIVEWAKQSQLHEAFGRWLDGPNGQQKFINA